jgi:hypothetical protein
VSSRHRAWRTAAAVLGGMAAVLIGSAVPISAPADAARNPPKPVLAHYVPSSAQVTGERSVRLTRIGPAQVVVTYERALPNSQGSHSRDLIILSWDHFAKRWVTVFDGARMEAPGGTLPGISENAVLPSSADVYSFHFAPITSAKGQTDLAFWSTYNFGANAFLEGSIVHYNGQVARLGYYVEGVPGQKAPSVIGAAPHQELSVPEAWLTSADPQCCPVRSYTNIVKFKNKRYVVASNTQSWLGVYAVSDVSTGTGPPPDPTVLSVVPGGPAAGVLQVGDQLVSVSGIKAPSNNDLGPAVIDEVAQSLPGATIALTIERGGAQRVVNIKLGSTVEPSFTKSSAPVPGYLGLDVTSVTPALRAQYEFTPTSGALVVNVLSNSPADGAGLAQGEVITSFGSTAIATAQDLQNATDLTPPGTTLKITYASGASVGQTASVTMGAFPSDNPGPFAFSM